MRDWRKANPEKAKEQRQRQQQRIAEMVVAIKSAPCADCRRTYPPVAMDFDHVSGVKKFGLSQASKHTMKAVLAEIAKCELVCSNCHRIRTERRRTEGR